MNSTLNAYLHFLGNAREAMEFYASVLGGKLEMSTFGENGMTHDNSDADKIMHATVTLDNGMKLMGSDTPVGMEYKEGTSISMSLSGENEAELKGYWDKLSA